MIQPSGFRSAPAVLAAVLVLFGIGAGHAPLSAGEPPAEPLPDPAAFAREVRARLRTDRALQSQYTFLERNEEVTVSKLGKVEEGPVKIYEVYPSADPGNTYKRLVSVDGVPLSAEELANNDEKHRQDVLEALERRQRETPEQRRRRLAQEAKERREEQAIFDEIFEAYDIRLVGRDVIDGRRMVIATLEPRPGHKPRTEAGKLMKKARARAWIDEQDYQIARVETEVVEDMTFGWGFVGRLHKGTRGVFERRKINGEVWLPSRVEFRASGRTLLFRKFALDTTTTYSDYRKFSVATEESFITGK